VIRPYALNVAIPLVDLTPETGTTKLFPGSHNRSWSEDQFELPYIARGGCYLVDYRLSHQGTENRGAAERPIVYLVYARPWFTDIKNYGENVRINIAEHSLSAIPSEHRPLFRRLAAKGAFDRTVKDLFAG
jgi:ectoine hydroxylase-related dioxygenase (phytanoyl-CoA dioxygenase family)